MQFSFKLRGNDWFLIYLGNFIICGIPSIALQFVAKKIENDPQNMTLLLTNFGLLTLTIFGSILFAVPILKAFINNTYLDNKPFAFTGTIGEFFILNLSNLLLTIITIGIYVPWYITKVVRYGLSNIFYNNQNFSFNSKALSLLLIFLFSLFLPLILFSIIFSLAFPNFASSTIYSIIFQILVYFILIPYMYYFFKWLLNITFSNYSICWRAIDFDSLIFILKEFAFSVFTVGIYLPVAFLKLYEYFSEQTLLENSNNNVLTFKAKFDYFQAWKFMWLQIILTIVTLGIYGAWGYSNIARLLVDNTKLIPGSKE